MFRVQSVAVAIALLVGVPAMAVTKVTSPPKPDPTQVESCSWSKEEAPESHREGVSEGKILKMKSCEGFGQRESDAEESEICTGVAYCSFGDRPPSLVSVSCSPYMGQCPDATECYGSLEVAYTKMTTRYHDGKSEKLKEVKDGDEADAQSERE